MRGSECVIMSKHEVGGYSVAMSLLVIGEGGMDIRVNWKECKGGD